MKYIATLLFCLVVVCLPAQENKSIKQDIYFKDGSHITGTVKDTVIGEQEMVNITFANGTTAIINPQEICRIEDQRKNYVIFPSGKKLIEKGRYTTIAVEHLRGKKFNTFETEKRRNLGLHISGGYMFRRSFGMGVGIGIVHQNYNFMPVFAEFRGIFTQNKKQERPIKTRKVDWFGVSATSATKAKRKLPICYNFQIGYNAPIEEWLNDVEFIKIKGGFMFYPAIGFIAPSRHGAAFQFDVGYKLQRYTEETDFDTWVFTTEKYTLKSVALRMATIF